MRIYAITNWKKYVLYIKYPFFGHKMPFIQDFASEYSLEADSETPDKI